MAFQASYLKVRRIHRYITGLQTKASQLNLLHCHMLQIYMSHMVKALLTQYISMDSLL